MAGHLPRALASVAQPWAGEAPLTSKGHAPGGWTWHDACPSDGPVRSTERGAVNERVQGPTQWSIPALHPCCLVPLHSTVVVASRLSSGTAANRGMMALDLAVGPLTAPPPLW